MPRSVAGNKARRVTGQRAGVRSQLKGAASTRKLLKQLPGSVKEELADMLGRALPQLLAAMKAAAPKRSGALQAALSGKLLRASLRLRVGLLDKATAAKFFYGRIVEFGRKEQVVAIKKGRRAGARMRVRAMAPRPYVYSKQTDVRAALRRDLNEFWNRSLATAAAGAGDD